MNDEIQKIINESSELIKRSSNLSEKIIETISAIVNCFEQGNKIIIFGNGGSAADAQHIAAEFVGRFQLERQSLPAIALTTDTSVITSISNDYTYDMIF